MADKRKLERSRYPDQIHPLVRIDPVCVERTLAAREQTLRNEVVEPAGYDRVTTAGVDELTFDDRGQAASLVRSEVGDALDDG
jgi:hypothetical protein